MSLSSISSPLLPVPRLLHFLGWEGGCVLTEGNPNSFLIIRVYSEHPRLAHPILHRLQRPGLKGNRGVSRARGGRILSFLPSSESPTVVRVTSQ